MSIYTLGGILFVVVCFVAMCAIIANAKPAEEENPKPTKETLEDLRDYINGRRNK